MKAVKSLLALPLLIQTGSCTSQEERNRRVCADCNMLGYPEKDADQLGIKTTLEIKGVYFSDSDNGAQHHILISSFCAVYGISR